MYIKSTKQITKFKRSSKFGKTVEYEREKELHHLLCDGCGGEFSRDISQIGHHRLNNSVKHFCNQCGQKVVGKFANSKRLKTFEIGNKLLTGHGYIETCVGDNTSYSGVKGGYIREHIKVMQDYLGRQLIKGEVVHHIDGDKTNNDISNLDLCTVTEHNNAHAKIEQIVFELVKQGKVSYDRVTKRYHLL
jgi:hypothetical protein